jgi:hypothetical protein
MRLDALCVSRQVPLAPHSPPPLQLRTQRETRQRLGVAMEMEGAVPVYEMEAAVPVYEMEAAVPVYEMEGAVPVYEMEGAVPVYEMEGAVPVYEMEGAVPVYAGSVSHTRQRLGVSEHTGGGGGGQAGLDLDDVTKTKCGLHYVVLVTSSWSRRLGHGVLVTSSWSRRLGHVVLVTSSVVCTMSMGRCCWTWTWACCASSSAPSSPTPPRPCGASSSPGI